MASFLTNQEEFSGMEGRFIEDFVGSPLRQSFVLWVPERLVRFERFDTIMAFHILWSQYIHFDGEGRQKRNLAKSKSRNPELARQKRTPYFQCPTG
jgi:hypothetical protein